MRSAVGAMLFLSVTLSFTLPTAAQEIVHALSGTVISVDPASKTLTFNPNDGSQGTFSYAKGPQTAISFDENVSRETIPVSSASKANDEVVLLFYGDDTVRNAVAEDDLGPGPFVNTTAVVTRFDKHDHLLTVKDTAGKTATYQIGPKTIADTSGGVVPGLKFSAQKGDNLRVIASTASPGMALFLREQ